ncbi:hypothetical protein AZA_84562 [Nitrospirillum viridazoti Y2]|nr:hypothetical protein AZA_84562 [Nitrospirillum amazonense Y2]
MIVSQRMPSQPRARHPVISGPRIRPALLPKSDTTTGGPRSLMVASGLPAGSIPIWSAPTRSAASSSVQLTLPAGASALKRKTYSASTAAKPPTKVGKGVTAPLSASQTLRAKMGPARRGSPSVSSQSGGMRPIFQPAMRSGHRPIATSCAA